MTDPTSSTGTNQAGPFSVEITADEWIVAAQVARFVDRDEQDIRGMVRLTSDGSQRRWLATDERVLMTATGGSDERRYELLVSPRLVLFAASMLLDGERATLRSEIDEGGEPTSTALITPRGSLEVSADPRPFVDIDHVLDDIHPAEAASIELDGLALALTIQRASLRAVADEEVSPDFWLGISGQVLDLQIDWPGLGLTRFELEGERTGDPTNEYGVTMPAGQLADALDGWTGPVTVTIPAFGGRPIRFRGVDRLILVMPSDNPSQRARQAVEELFTEVFGPEVVERDADGDYSLTIASPHVRARLMDGPPTTLQVFATVLDDVQPTPELAMELNDINAGLQYARTFHVGGQVLAESDLVAETIDAAELTTAFGRVRQLATDLAPVLSAVHGGELASDGVDERWATYADTVVSVQEPDGTWSTLTGPDAVQTWPFEGAVHLITASDPYGRLRPPDVNDANNAELVYRLWSQGHPGIPARGSDPVGEHFEDGALFRDLDRGAATAIGRDFGQEAIFEIDADEVRIVGCFAERVESWPRRASDAG